MTVTRSYRCTLVAALTALACVSGPLAQATATAASLQAPAVPPAEDSLAQARTLYASAAYDEALAMLDRLSTSEDTSPQDATGVAEYRVFCMLALGRTDDARRVIEGIYRKDPFYKPAEGQAAPRILSVIQEVRRQLMPGIVLSTYADAKAAFDRKDPAATQQFERVLELLGDPDAKAAPALKDLATVVVGFRDLSKAMSTPPPAAPVLAAAPPSTPDATAPPPGSTAPPSTSKPPVTSAGAKPPVATPPASGRQDPPRTPPASASRSGSPASSARAGAPAVTPSPVKEIYELADQDVIPPLATYQKLPVWSPSRADAHQEFRGVLHVIITEKGIVESANMRVGAHPTYDSELLSMAREWRFRPATRQGVAVKYMQLIDITLRPPR